jgi:hypothetical protein
MVFEGQSGGHRDLSFRGIDTIKWGLRSRVLSTKKEVKKSIKRGTKSGPKVTPKVTPKMTPRMTYSEGPNPPLLLAPLWALGLGWGPGPLKWGI